MGSWSPGPATGAAHLSGTLETPTEPRPGRQACWQVEPWEQATAGELVALSKVLQEVGIGMSRGEVGPWSYIKMPGQRDAHSPHAGNALQSRKVLSSYTDGSS